MTQPAKRVLPAAAASGAGAEPGATAASAIPVSALTRTAKDVLEGAFPPLWVRGEIANFKAHQNGHWFFTLHDDEAQVRCVVWARDTRGIAAAPDDGMEVFVYGQLSVWPERGEMRFAVTAMDAAGDGLRMKALRALTAKLEREGLFAAARKRPLPFLPRRIAVVTSPTGAALRDIIAVARRRCPIVEIIVAPSLVQGDAAPAELCAALARVAHLPMVDTVIIGRGGGPSDDLWAFNDEQVARALADCPYPTISAVGHEVDVTLCDLVADWRAPTPSAAAEAAVPVLDDERAKVARLAGTLRDALERRAALARDRYGRAQRDLRRALEQSLERRRARFQQAAAGLNALSPLATLGRGYAVARDARGAPLTSVARFALGLAFELTLRDGAVPSTVTGAPRFDAADRAGGG